MKNNPYMLRALYIILVPLVLLIILLNSGWLQRFIPAATIHGENISVVRYNYYYYDYQTTFLHDHEHELDELGYNVDLDAERQDYNESMTWKEFFQQQAEAVMAEIAYYCALAEEAGYQFSEEELAPVAERLAQNTATATNSGISMKNYYVAYYGPGMDEDRYEAELTRVVKAQVYKQHLMDTWQVDEAAMEDYLSQYSGADYTSVELRIISMNATVDRATGQVGQPQLDALQAKLDALKARYEAGADLTQLQQAFSDGEEGVVFLTRATELPDAFVTHYIDSQAAGNVEPVLAFVDEDGGVAYFAVALANGANGPEMEGRMELGTQGVEQAWQQARGDWYPEQQAFGMLLAGS